MVAVSKSFEMSMSFPLDHASPQGYAKDMRLLFGIHSPGHMAVVNGIALWFGKGYGGAYRRADG